ncbi:MAG: UvrB/UvrC motif-containing protein [Sphingomonas sp.]|nr:UvrB/UvrC motif-containing protein [Sphingomonas sp.]
MIGQLRREMAAAADTLDFDRARQLRDRIALLRGGADPEAAAQADTSGVTRHQPGAMGLGTGRERPQPPPDWKKPRKPDPMTKGRSRRTPR